nr:HEAT repeat domain-containing protein [Granulosicoccus sp.]
MNNIFESFSELDELSEQLTDDDPGMRQVAVLDLGECSDPAAIPLLDRALQDNESKVREQAALM